QVTGVDIGSHLVGGPLLGRAKGSTASRANLDPGSFGDVQAGDLGVLLDAAVWRVDEHLVAPAGVPAGERERRYLGALVDHGELHVTQRGDGEVDPGPTPDTPRAGRLRRVVRGLDHHRRLLLPHL